MRTSEPEMSQFEQRANIKFCQKLGKTAAETFQMMQQVYGEDAHSMPRILSQDQRDDRMTICGDLISSADDDPTFLNRIITGDETLCCIQLRRLFYVLCKGIGNFVHILEDRDMEGKGQLIAIEDQFLRLQVLRNRHTTAVEARNRLEQVRGVNVKLTRQHHQTRLQFDREHQEWTDEQWGTVLFSMSPDSASDPQMEKKECGGLEKDIFEFEPRESTQVGGQPLNTSRATDGDGEREREEEEKTNEECSCAVCVQKLSATGFEHASNRARGRRNAGTLSICMLKGRGGVLRQRDEGRLRAQLLSEGGTDPPDSSRSPSEVEISR
ncbi:hypothetical protein ANN_24907 [Periplaneta americana]|uniref:Uncharacterized protein n=1 Tax=Periplaneta americana TaxID=6978 RepID=A0ABQ8RZW8_PERAM|nr:hypothetical protein ANN_24907 [Periplaneta americana]